MRFPFWNSATSMLGIVCVFKALDIWKTEPTQCFICIAIGSILLTLARIEGKLK
jgi:hypothetical protein